MQNLFDLSGRVALVTGGSGALGEAMCLGLAQAGATVLVAARDTDKIDATVARISDAGGQAAALPLDVLDPAATRQAITEAVAQYGAIDILVNGAGGNRPDATVMPDQRTLFDLPEDALRWVFDLNLMGTLLPSLIVGEVMAKQGHGVIVNISSMASMKVLTRVIAYSAAKAAVNNFTQWMAVYMASEVNPAIRVNAIAPGFFLGEQNRFLLMNEDESLTERGSQIIAHTPMGRFGAADDLVGTLLWLCSDASHFVTGIIVPVDGGFSVFSGI